MTPSIVHPRRDPLGRDVQLAHPSRPTPLETWDQAGAIATVVPDGPLPLTLNGLRLDPWRDVPCSPEGWERQAGASIAEPPFQPPPGLRSAAGVVTLEPCGRVWVISPSNRFGGYENTFPKGTADPGNSLRATAVKEAFEEAGLQVVLTGFLVDCARSESYTRYYLARRTGGDPSQMGWESQAVHLVPPAKLAGFVTSQYDAPILAALQRRELASSSKRGSAPL
jgi:ADP-ribose pyrophosphatase YjhB (NUDIX family)